ncbi:MAG: MIP/aquaporin family protein [Spirochaetota bacterium]
MNEVVAEFVGTCLLMLLGNAVNANLFLKGTKGRQSGWIMMTLGWGLAVFCAVTVAGPFSGAHLNPAVTIGLAAAGLFAWSKVPIFILVQLLGAMLGAGIVWLNFKHHFNAEEDAATKLAIFSTGPAISNPSNNFICELTGTFVLVFVILFITEPKLSAEGMANVKLGLGSVGAIPVAFLVVAIGMGLGGTTGYAINPARDLGPRIMHALLPIQGKGGSNWSYAWIPVFAPITGDILAAWLKIGLTS